MTAPQPHQIGLLVADRTDRNLLSKFITSLGHVAVVCSADDMHQGRPRGLSLLITDQHSASRLADAINRMKFDALPLFLPVFVLIPARENSSRWIRVGFDAVVQLPVVPEELTIRLRLFLRMRAYSEDAQQEADHFVANIFDALSEHICVVDADSGRILRVNKAWSDFAGRNGMRPHAQWGGANYYQVCQVAAAAGSRDADAFLWGMKQVAAGSMPEFSYEYTCHAPTEERWFVAKVTRFIWNRATTLVVSHLDVSTTRRAENTLEHLAQHDALTGLPNRVHFCQSLSRAIARARHSGKSVGVLLADVDRFQSINDTLGHGAADLVLQQVVARLKPCLRSVHVMGRLGNDDFGIFLEGLDDSRQCAEVARNITTVLSQPVPVDGNDTYVSMSIGIAAFPQDGSTVDAVLNAADAAAHSAKGRGGARFEYFTAPMSDAVQRRAMVEKGLRLALERNEFSLVYQPQLDLRTGLLRGCEALIRWNHPELGEMSPADFIPIAEESDRILDIGKWVLVNACRQNKEWQDAGLPPFVVSVNLPAKQFREDGLPELVATVLEESGLEACCLELEITESMMMEDIDDVVAIMKRLEALGVRLAIDDFGTGYSNLGYFGKFPLDALKLDKSFVSGIEEVTSNSAFDIVKVVAVLAHTLKLEVIAEGVETQEQLELLRTAGYDVVQGYLISRPLRAAAFKELFGQQLGSAALAGPIVGTRKRAGPGFSSDNALGETTGR